MPNEVIVAIIGGLATIVVAWLSLAKGKKMADGDGPARIAPPFTCHAFENQNVSRELAERLNRRIDGIYSQLSDIKDLLHDKER